MLNLDGERITALTGAQAGGEGSDWRDMAPDEHEGHERWCSIRDADPCDCGPWEPGRPFKVGDRVRVRLRGECEWTCRCYFCKRPLAHARGEDGLIGTVLEPDTAEPKVWDAAPGHVYEVGFDTNVLPEQHCCKENQEVVEEWGGYDCGIYAAAELELLEPRS